MYGARDGLKRYHPSHKHQPSIPVDHPLTPCVCIAGLMVLLPSHGDFVQPCDFEDGSKVLALHIELLGINPERFSVAVLLVGCASRAQFACLCFVLLCFMLSPC